MFDILLIHGTVITVDREHHLYRDGYVAVEGDRIALVGDMRELKELPMAKRVIDVNGNAVLPGLVDGHGHGGHCLIKTLGEHYQNWLAMAEEIYYRNTDTDFWYAEGALAAAERMKFGITTGVSIMGSNPRMDILEPLEANLEASVSVGLRQMSGIGCAGGAWPKKARVFHKDGSVEEYQVHPDLAHETTREAVKRLNGKNPLATCIVAPDSMGWRPSEPAEANIRHNRTMYEIAKEYDVPLHTHAFGGDVQFMHDTTPEILNYKMSLVHSTGYSEEELNILAGSEAYVFHGPTTRSVIRKFCPAYEMLKRGIHLAVVTDGTAPDRSYDIWRDMKNVQLEQRIHEAYTGVLPCGKVLELVTIEPAKALGIDHLVGSLEKGKKADVIVVNVHQPHLAPFGAMPVERLVYHAMGQDVETSIIDGTIVMENRKLLLADETQILNQAERAFERMMERFGDWSVTKNPALYDLENVSGLAFPANR
ncbi:MAG: amidohydrolase family protein [Eubacteriales bacterium]|nr:amidohydrolase family protein [Eubacteriales bacterium]